MAKRRLDRKKLYCVSKKFLVWGRCSGFCGWEVGDGRKGDVYQIITPHPILPWLSLHFPVLPNANLSQPFSPSFRSLTLLMPWFVQAATAAKAASQRIVNRTSSTACA